MTGPQTRVVRFAVNGRPVQVTTEVRTLVSDLLRHDLELTGTHVGCEHGACGACTVLVDGAPMRSCLMLAPQVDGRDVRTVEGLAVGGDLDALQEAFRSEHGLQCGFCTPGILMTLTGEREAGRTVEDALAALPGHLCRCTGYVNVRAAVRRAWSQLEGS
ncbi:(2Fe-2S)-binding protein [soil metagenome]|nr:(2Fe-2S)-binding protein [Euzebyaceae bacterium]